MGEVALHYDRRIIELVNLHSSSQISVINPSDLKKGDTFRLRDRHDYLVTDDIGHAIFKCLSVDADIKRIIAEPVEGL